MPGDAGGEPQLNSRQQDALRVLRQRVLIKANATGVACAVIRYADRACYSDTAWPYCRNWLTVELECLATNQGGIVSKDTLQVEEESTLPLVSEQQALAAGLSVVPDAPSPEELSEDTLVLLMQFEQQLHELDQEADIVFLIEHFKEQLRVCCCPQDAKMLECHIRGARRHLVSLRARKRWQQAA